MFGYIRIIAYLNEKEPNYHVQRFMQAWNLGGQVISPKNIWKTFSKYFRKAVKFPLWNRVLWGRARLCIVICIIMWNHDAKHLLISHRNLLHTFQQLENIPKNTILVTAYVVHYIITVYVTVYSFYTLPNASELSFPCDAGLNAIRKFLGSSKD